MLTALAFGLRAAFVGDQSLGYEEVFTAGIVSHSSVAGVWRAVKATESTPPLFYVLTWLWVKLTASHSATALRTVSLLAGSTLVPVAFAAARRFASTRLALVVAWLCAISPVLVGYSIYARSYALMVLVFALSVWALAALLERQSRRRWALWALSAAACVWTHYFGGFLVIAEAAVLFVKLDSSRRELTLWASAIVVACAPLWPLFSAQSGASERTAYIAARPLGGRLEDVVRQFAMGTNVPSAALEAAGILLAVSAVVLGVAHARRRAPESQVLIAVGAITMGLPIVSALTGIDDHLLPRNVLGVWICVAPLAAYGLTRVRGIPLLGYSSICIAAVVAVQSDWRYQAQADWGGAAARISAAAAGDPIGVMPALELPVAAFYLHRRPLRAPVLASDLWVIVQPSRAAGQRALGPVRRLPLAQLWGAAFQPAREIDYRGFRLIHLHASSPAVVLPGVGSASRSGRRPRALTLAA